MNAQRPAQRTSAADSTRVHFRLLGKLEAFVDGEPVPLGTPKQRALLALLLLRANEAMPVDRLVDALWPDDPPASSRHAIQVYVSRLRRALGDASRIEARSRAYVLRSAPEELDLTCFRELVHEARNALASNDPAGAGQRLRDALALWGDRALADLDGEPSVQDLVLELEEERLEALELRVGAELEAGTSAELVAELERLAVEHPAREQFHAQLMLALHRAGRHDDALEAYAHARDSLVDELGLEPSVHLRELEAAIRRRDPALTPDPPEIRARRHLPAQTNRLIGRERELEELVELVTARGRRLVTLTGAGGIGKTRLAVAVGERLAASFEDGVWFVDLSVVADPGLVVATTAQSLGVTESADEPVDAALERHLAEKRALLVVDNFEHVTEAASSLGGLLRAAPELWLLVTSRSPLHLDDEHEYEVPALAVPDPSRMDSVDALAEVESVLLLTERARAVDRQFELTDGNAREIADVCVVLEGLPLALELAGARLDEFSPSELRDRLERTLDLLVAGPVDAPGRQQTMRATIEWSYGLLADAEKDVLVRLAVFSGGWTAEAAQAACGATEESLHVLREKRLIRADGERFAMLTPTREFALAALLPSAVPSLARKHATYFAEHGERAAAHAQEHGRDATFLDTFALDYENFRAALQFTRDEGERELFARLAAPVGEYCYVRGPYAEARDWLEAAFADPPADARLHALVARSLGMVCVEQRDYRGSLTAHRHALALFRSSGDTYMEAISLHNCGVAAINLGDHGHARELFTESRVRARGLVDARRRLRVEQLAVNELGYLEYLEGRRAEAEARFQECLTICEQIDDTEGAATALLNLGLVALGLDRLPDAAARFQRALRLADQLQRPQTTADCILGMAAVLARGGDPSRAGLLLGAADAMFADAGVELSPIERTIRDETVSGIHARLGEDAAEETFALGRGDERDAAVAYALEA